MDTSKKDGGIIENWTLNTLSFKPEQVRERGFDIKTDKVYILSGYIKEDPTGRFLPGWHFKSSVVLDVDFENGIVETANTIYHVEGKCNWGADLGNLILKVFY